MDMHLSFVRMNIKKNNLRFLFFLPLSLSTRQTKQHFSTSSLLSWLYFANLFSSMIGTVKLQWFDNV